MEIKIGKYTITGGPLWYIRRNGGGLFVTDSPEVKKIIRAEDRVRLMEEFWNSNVH